MTAFTMFPIICKRCKEKMKATLIDTVIHVDHICKTLSKSCVACAGVGHFVSMNKGEPSFKCNACNGKGYL